MKRSRGKGKIKPPTPTYRDQRTEFLDMLSKVTVVYEDNAKNTKAKREKIQILNLLLEWIAEGEKQFVEYIMRPHFGQIMQMIDANIFRALPSYKEAELDAMD
jgi:L-amino acid N-acyltransferase YncA